MSMKARIAVLTLAIAFVAAPALGAIALAACPPCEMPPAHAPCEPGAIGCASLAAASCCELAPVTAPAKRSTEQPTPQPVIIALRASTPAPPHAPAPRIAAGLALRSSPLRLSVVLRI
jgi:hypothetical protein